MSGGENQRNGETTCSARERLLSAAVEVLLDRGYRGATSREIARMAQVNEVTLFRLFSTKDDLLAEAIVERAATDRESVPAPTGDMQADLENLGELAVRSLSGGGHLLARILPEIPRLPAEQRKVVREALVETQKSLVALFRHYQDLGRLVGEPAEFLCTSFMGPILMVVGAAHSREEPVQFDASQHVRVFLEGARERAGQ
ncbi:MAG: helix-turn-helix domain-containing protein [Armatimonadia bacterium]